MTKAMTQSISSGGVTSLGKMARIRRIYQGQTLQDVADIAGVSPREVELFENDRHLSPDIKRKLLRAYDLLVETESEKQFYSLFNP